MEYELIIVGGGLAGATLGMALAKAGIRVLILERDVAFKDRVRGEAMCCWGGAEAHTLGISDRLKETNGQEVRRLFTQIVGLPEMPGRDLVETSPGRIGMLTFYHPDMQSVALTAAEQAGAVVRRGVPVLSVLPGCPAAVCTREDDGECIYRTRLVVVADGRDSSCRKRAGFSVSCDPERMIMAGMLFEGLRAPEDQIRVAIHPPLGLFAIAIPLGNGRFRSYAAVYRQGEPVRLSGRRAVSDFVATSVAAGMPSEWYDGATAAGPLACFEAADRWVEHPYRDGVALVGDAAATSDPSWGCGLSLTLRDVRVLRDRLTADTDWDRAAHGYAEEHDRDYGAIHRLTDWMTMLFYDPGPAGAARRARAFPGLAENWAARVPDIIGLGPEAASDEAARRRLFGED